MDGDGSNGPPNCVPVTQVKIAKMHTDFVFVAAGVANTCIDAALLPNWCSA